VVPEETYKRKTRSRRVKHDNGIQDHNK
jgi:hypothetical protein